MAMSDLGPEQPRPRSRWRRRDVYQRASIVDPKHADADARRREAELAQQRAEAHRAAAESTAFAVAKERDDALQRVAALEEQLSAVLAVEEPEETAPPQTQRGEPAGPARPAEPEPEPEPEVEAVVEVSRPDLVEFGTRGGHAVLAVLLGLGSLTAAAVAVYLAVLDQLVTLHGLAASGVTLLLALAVRRTGRTTTQVSIRRGTVTVAHPDGVDRVDLTSPAVLFEVLGDRGDRNRKVVFVRRTRPPLTVDRRMVDVDAFVDAIRLWRP
jgi:hypothetical protein